MRNRPSGRYGPPGNELVSVWTRSAGVGFPCPPAMNLNGPVGLLSPLPTNDVSSRFTSTTIAIDSCWTHIISLVLFFQQQSGNMGVCGPWSDGWVDQHTLELSAACSFGLLTHHRTGYPMAKNLRSKIPPSDVLVVNDINLEVTRRFVHEFRIANPVAGTLDDGVGIEIAKSPRDVAERSVCSCTFLHLTRVSYMMSTRYR